MNKTARIHRPRHRKDGRLALIKRPDAARNGRPHKVFLMHGALSKTLRTGLPDRRSVFGKLHAALVQGYRQHLGDTLSLPQEKLCDQAARLNLLTAIAWAELNKTGLFRKGRLSSAFEGFIKASRDEREVLRLLGLERRPKDVPDLQTYLRQKRLEKKEA